MSRTGARAGKPDDLFSDDACSAYRADWGRQKVRMETGEKGSESGPGEGVSVLQWPVVQFLVDQKNPRSVKESDRRRKERKEKYETEEKYSDRLSSLLVRKGGFYRSAEV